MKVQQCNQLGGPAKIADMEETDPQELLNDRSANPGKTFCGYFSGTWARDAPFQELLLKDKITT